MTDPVPTIGRIVLYRLRQSDADSINERPLWSTARGNRVTEGEVYPMVIVKVWGDSPNAAVNGQVMLDGDDTLWATSVSCGDKPGEFAWPQRS